MIKNIYLQRFAEETIPAKQEEVKDIGNKPEEPKPFTSTIRSIFGLKDKEPVKAEPAKEIDKKPDEKPVEEKPVEEKPETSKEPDTKEPEKAAEEEYDTLTVLGKEKKVPVSERKMWMQKGMDYDFVKGEKVKAEAALLRVAKLEGFNTVDEYLAEVGNREKAKLAEQIEEAAGDPDKINEIVQNHPVVVKTKEERRELDYVKAKTELSKSEFFAKLEPELDRLMEVNPTADPKLVYPLIVGQYVMSDEYKQEQAAKGTQAAQEKAEAKAAAERKVISNTHDKERRTTPKGGDAGDGKDVVMASDFTKKISDIFGVSASKVAQRSHEKMKRS